MEASRELAVREEERPLVTKKDVDDWLFGSGTKLTEQQKSLFYQVCLTNQLNPIKREVYAIPYGNNFNIITGYEVYLKRAERTGNLDGWEASVETKGGELIGKCTVWRKDRSHPTTIEAWFNEYNQNNNMWKTKPRTMIRKVAVAQAFRMAFPDELGGLPYTSDEIVIEGEIITPKTHEKPPEAPQEAKKGKGKATPQAEEDRPAPGPTREQKQKALDFMAANFQKSQDDCEAYLDKYFEDWQAEEIDLLRSWAKELGKGGA